MLQRRNEGFAGGSDIVLLESNYDCKMLRNGPYPYSLQQRISAGHGHISNEECARSADSLIRLGSRRFVLGHLSPNNNTEELAITSLSIISEAADMSGTVIMKFRSRAKSIPARVTVCENQDCCTGSP